MLFGYGAPKEMAVKCIVKTAVSTTIVAVLSFGLVARSAKSEETPKRHCIMQGVG
jgi:hypothetical protein